MAKCNIGKMWHQPCKKVEGPIKLTFRMVSGVDPSNHVLDGCAHLYHLANTVQEGLAVASIARDDPSPLPGMHRDPMHFRHRQTDRQTDGH